MGSKFCQSWGGSINRGWGNTRGRNNIFTFCLRLEWVLQFIPLPLHAPVSLSTHPISNPQQGRAGRGEEAVELLPLFWYPELLTLIFVSYVIRIRKHLTHTHRHTRALARASAPPLQHPAYTQAYPVSLRLRPNHMPRPSSVRGYTNIYYVITCGRVEVGPGTGIGIAMELQALPYFWCPSSGRAVSHSFDWGPLALKRFTSTWFCMFGAPDAI